MIADASFVRPVTKDTGASGSSGLSYKVNEWMLKREVDSPFTGG